MRNSLTSKCKVLLTTCFAIVASVCIAIACCFTLNFTTVKAAGSTLPSYEFKTDGSSVRVFEKDVEGNFVETERTGIRFHVEMGNGYSYGGQTVVDTSATNERNDSFKLREGFKTYTIIIPTRLLTEELSLSTDKIMKLDTSEYWYYDGDENLESVAYVWNVPETRLTDNFSFRGVICTVDENGVETVIAQTEVAERCIAGVSKMALKATNDGDHNWGDKEDKAIEILKGFIPKYDITYLVNGVETYETVLWGDTPTEVPANGQDAWYDVKNSEEVDLTKAMDFSTNRTLELHTTTSEDFVLTGVASETDFEVDGNTYHGVKVFATLHREAFASKTEMDIHAVNIEHKRGAEVLCDGIELQGVWTIDEQNSLGEWQMRLFFALDTSTLQSGDEIVIKGDSVFYANNVMYKLTEDYTIDYTKQNDVEDYGMYLGDLYNSDVKNITNCSEDSSGQEGAPDEFTLRVEFYEDVMINGEFTFEFGPDSDTTTYPYPVYIRCGSDKNKLIPISGGRYYWNEGDHKILELIGAGEYENTVFGWHNGDELIGAPGTIVKQNGGYYVFKDEMYGYFLAKNGEFDKWGYALGDWVVGDELAEYTASEFSAEGSTVETTDYGALADEIRINTTNHWFGQSKVSLLTTEKMLDSAPYAIYCTSKDDTVTEIDKVRYHGQTKPEGGNYQILGLCGEGKFTVGDVVTISEGTRFWLGTEYYTVTEEITYYYNGNFWIQDYDESTMGTLSSANFGDRAHNQGATEMRMYFTAPLAGYTTTDGGAFDTLRIGTGSITFNGKALSYVRYQRWDANSTWLSFGGYSGSVAFGDKVVIEAGTTIWGPNNVAYKFTETVEWIYVNNPDDANRNWSRVLGGVTVSAIAENASVIGAGTFAVGETYTIKVAPTDGYLISAVIVNNGDLPLNASNTYTFTVEQTNTIYVQSVVGHHVTFTIPEGATVNDGTISNGGFGVVAHGNDYTFSVAVNEGYKLLSVTGATDNGDGTYTASNVTANTTITISVEKLYQVNYSGNNASITANVASGTWVDNGTTVTFTVSVNSGCTLVGVSNATKVNATTYTATVNGADLNVVATALKNDEFVDITDRIQIEDRAWGVTEDKHAGGSNEVYVGVLDTGITNADGTHYFNTSVNGTWYVGNDAIITTNGGVDIMEYIYVNGVSARSLITTNANGVRNSNACACWLSNPAAYPVYVETTNGSGLMIRLAKAAFGTEFTITIKAGFRITNAGGELVVVTKDVEFNYNGGTVGRKYSTASVSTSNANISGVVDEQELTNGNIYTFTTSASSGYAITSVTINGVEQGTSGSYSFTASGTKVEIVVTAKKLFAVTWSNPTGATITVTANGNSISSGTTVVEGTSISVTVTASSGYTVNSVTVDGNALSANNGVYTFTLLKDSTINVSTSLKTYTATLSATGASVSGVSNNQTITHGQTYNFTTSVNNGYQLTSVTINGVEQGTSGSYSFTASGATSIVVTAKKLYAVTWSNPTGATISVTANGNAINSGDTVIEGTSISVTATASSGYAVTSVKINNTEQGTGGSYSFTVSGATSIVVTAAKTYTVTASCSGGVSVSNTPQTVVSGGSVTFNLNVPSNATIKANGTQISGTTYTVSNVTADTTVTFTTWYAVTVTSLTEGSVKVNGTDRSVNSSELIESGKTITVQATYNQENDRKCTAGSESWSDENEHTVTISGKTEITVYSKSGDCLAEGTLITMADRTKLAVENVRQGDYVMSFDHTTGKIVNSEVIIVVKIACTYNKNTFIFDDGSKLVTINEHGIFDLDLNKYVNIDHNNYHEYLGHSYVSIDVNGKISSKKLIDVICEVETGYKYDIVTNQTLNYVAEDTLSVTHVLVDVINTFEFGENLIYDQEQMLKDIETYGLYTYDEWSEYCDISVFEEYNIPVMKVGISKGLYTKEYIIHLINKYVLDENVQII